MWWVWRVDVEVFLLLFSLLLFVVAVDLAGGGDGGWMWWLWVDAVADGAENNWVEKEKDRGERRKNKKVIKERIFKWNVKKIRSFDGREIVKWCVICYKIRF